METNEVTSEVMSVEASWTVPSILAVNYLGDPRDILEDAISRMRPELTPDLLQMVFDDLQDDEDLVITLRVGGRKND